VNGSSGCLQEIEKNGQFSGNIKIELKKRGLYNV
jgi:hypothetical protein